MKTPSSFEVFAFAVVFAIEYTLYPLPRRLFPLLFAVDNASIQHNLIKQHLALKQPSSAILLLPASVDRGDLDSKKRERSRETKSRQLDTKRRVILSLKTRKVK
jgi:hypothetical protein